MDDWSAEVKVEIEVEVEHRAQGTVCRLHEMINDIRQTTNDLIK
jgi:hypothetical protein